jgi:aerobic-type carbon monoxide dehydrogenase small subunit (CoxS/CutS family)
MSDTSARAGTGLAVTQHGPGRSTAATQSGPVATAAAAKGPEKFKISVNGEDHTVEVVATMPLLYVLRDFLDLKGPKFGCGLSECGACAVLLDGVQIRSCITPISAVGKEPVVTLEGLAAHYRSRSKETVEVGTETRLHPLQQAWIDKQVPQCGYCQSGMMIQAAELLSKNLDPTTDEIKAHMNGHLCRCGTYFRIVDGIKEAARVMRAA